MLDFDAILKEVKSFKSGLRKNPPASQCHFAAYLLDKGYQLNELPEEEWRGVAAELVGPDRDRQEAWLEDLAGWIGQPQYGGD